MKNKDFKYKFNGKELQPETGLYDYGARFYLPDIGRWLNIDPMAEKYSNVSPYAYVNNNPIMLIDPTGMMPEGWGRKGNIWEYKKEITIDNYKRLGYEQYMDSGNIYSTTNGIANGEYNYSLNSDGSVQDFQGNFIKNSFLTGRGTIINIGINNDGYLGVLGASNTIIGGASIGLEITPGSFRTSTTKRGFSPKYYANAWKGNQYAKTFNIGKIGSALGKVTFAASLALDTYGVITGKTSIGKAGLNLGMGVYGIYVNPIAGTFYGGLEAFYPGGTLGAMRDYSEAQSMYRATNNGAVIKPGL
uniref:RHS repeat-associated core domain-containing protein n=1 Tax=Ornithobacterium rhinotracheale TaxID=28251 RepID=UPI0039A5F1E0